MPIKVSFILPCYKVAPYVGRCIESIECQDISQEEYEIICVDDCSPDNTGEVVRQYQQLYSNIVYHRHAVNKTSGGARNTGIDLAQGEYIWFVDPDDAVVENCLGYFYDRANKQHADILFCNMFYTNESRKRIAINQFNDIDANVSGQQFVLKNCPNRRMAEITSIWRALYRLDFLRKDNLRFPEIKSSQDVVFGWSCILKAQRVGAVNGCYYEHYRRSDSMTGSKGKFKAIPTLSASLLYAVEIKFVADNLRLESEQFKKDLYFEMKDSLNTDSRKVLSMENNQVRLFYDECRKRGKEIVLLREYMNSNTQHIFDVECPYFYWWLKVMFIKLKRKLK